MSEWSCYIIKNGNRTYVGATNNVIKRLRAHNGEISGGAKYTSRVGKGWEHVCIIEGFPTKIECLQFEWALKHVGPKNKGGIQSRIKKLEILLHKLKWTTSAPLAETMPLNLEWNKIEYRQFDLKLPYYITESSSNSHTKSDCSL